MANAKLLALFATLLATGNAFVLLTSPRPFNHDQLGEMGDALPMHPDGEDFPCKDTANYTPPKEANIIPKRETQNMEFLGWKSLGGGSCQVSLTTDKEPTKDSKWRVIKSIMGGCPVTGKPEDEGVPFIPDSNMTFMIPDDVPSGEYTLAWTWFNNQGNREMYMNCAPIEVTGDDSEDAVPIEENPDLPKMFVANVGLTECLTKPGNLLFPEPGLYDQIGDKDFFEIDDLPYCTEYYLN